MIRHPPRSTLSSSSAASDVYKRQPQEDEKIYYLIKMYGKSWVQIASHLPGRTENSIKNRYYSSQRSLAQKVQQVQEHNKKLPYILQARGFIKNKSCLLYTSPSPRDRQKSRMPSSA
eukprot:TRINITY_DN26674_c0_g1_i1.p1 TRINITY_DN26674_c0_g1~~TRINITY_DN26674_c0_g1_i1.p1  ORF type:complete len:117 (-),score=20.52 TRINITY_DN26674_c0_g1_i1:48-398(-)